MCFTIFFFKMNHLWAPMTFWLWRYYVFRCVVIRCILYIVTSGTKWYEHKLWFIGACNAYMFPSHHTNYHIYVISAMINWIDAYISLTVCRVCVGKAKRTTKKLMLIRDPLALTVLLLSLTNLEKKQYIASPARRRWEEFPDMSLVL